MKQRKIQAIAFDMWGTLFNGGGTTQYDDVKEILGNRNLNTQAFVKQMEKSLMTKTWPLEEGMEELGRKLGLKSDAKTAKEAADRWCDWVRILKPFPETGGVLKKLKEKGLRMVVISNTDSFSMPFMIVSYGWNHFFEKYFLSTDYGVLKPHRKIFQAVEEHFGLPKERILMVDDSLYHGVEPARKYGWQACWVARGKEGADQMKIEDLRGLLNFV